MRSTDMSACNLVLSPGSGFIAAINAKRYQIPFGATSCLGKVQNSALVPEPLFHKTCLFLYQPAHIVFFAISQPATP
jgi:hypothetical protein